MSRHRGISISNTKTEVKPSPGRGRGVYALEAFGEGDLIEVAPVLQVPKADVPLLSATFLVDYFFADPLDDEQEVLALGHASLYNHADEPNAEWVIGKGMIMIRAVRPIEAGQEIFVDYGWGEDEYEAQGFK